MKSNDIIEEERAQKNRAPQNEEQPINSTPEDNGGNSERLFTQQEVNHIVAERLARERSKSGPTQEEFKEQELARQELELQFRQILFNGEYPVDDIMDFFNNIDLTTVEGFQETINRLDFLLEAFLAHGEKLRAIRAANGSKRIGEPKTNRGAAMERALKEIFSRGGKQ